MIIVSLLRLSVHQFRVVFPADPPYLILSPSLLSLQDEFHFRLELAARGADVLFSYFVLSFFSYAVEADGSHDALREQVPRDHVRPRLFILEHGPQVV